MIALRNDSHSIRSTFSIITRTRVGFASVMAIALALGSASCGPNSIVRSRPDAGDNEAAVDASTDRGPTTDVLTDTAPDRPDVTSADAPADVPMDIGVDTGPVRDVIDVSDAGTPDVGTDVTPPGDVAVDVAAPVDVTPDVPAVGADVSDSAVPADVSVDVDDDAPG